MCGTTDDLGLYEWRTELPDSPGDWLWVQCFSCGCVIASGIAWVHENAVGEEISRGDRPLRLSWQAEAGRRPKTDAHGRWHVDYWMKVAIPKED